MQSNLDVKSLETSILTFAELLKTALLFNPLTHASAYAKAQQFTVAPKGKFNAQVTEFAGEKLLDGPKYEFNLGVWYSLLDSIACICADNRFYPEIETGAITPPISDTFDGSLRFQNYSAKTDRQVLIYPNFPHIEEKMRIALADQQIEIAVKFVSLHEQAHVFAGHLLYIVESGATKLLEIADDEPETTAAEERRAMELEADAIAFQTILQFCFGKIQELRAKEPRFFNIFSDTNWLIACVSATVIVCCLFEIADSVQTKKLEDRLHPSAKCRTLSVFQTFISILIEIVDTDAELHFAIRRVLQNIETIFSILDVEPLEKEAIQWTWKPSSTAPNCASVNELIRLREVLNLLKPELFQYQAEVGKRLQNKTDSKITLIIPKL